MVNITAVTENFLVLSIHLFKYTISIPISIIFAIKTKRIIIMHTHFIYILIVKNQLLI